MQTKAIYRCAALLIGVALASITARADPFELATQTRKTGEVVAVEAFGYAKLNLVRMDVDHTGDIVLKGAYSVEGGTATLVLWAKVQGRYYFSKLPELQGAGPMDNRAFAIPFHSPDHPITELVLNVELPNGGELEISDIELSKSR